MIVNDLGFDYLIFGEETIPCMAHHLEHPDNQDMPWPVEPLPTKVHLGYCFIGCLIKYIQILKAFWMENDCE